MSQIHRIRGGGRSGTVISGTLMGSGTLSIPQGVVNVSLTGRGGNGGNNYWYNPGQAYIAPSGWVAGQPAVQTQYYWKKTYRNSSTVYGQSYGPNCVPAGQQLPFPPGQGDWSGRGYYTYSDAPNYPANYTGETVVWAYSSGTPGSYTVTSMEYDGVVTVQGSAATSGYYSNPGQSYVAPSSGGGPYTGTSTTATVNGSTKTWTGGYDTGGIGAISTQVAISAGTGQSLTYSVADSGYLAYEYEV